MVLDEALEERICDDPRSGCAARWRRLDQEAIRAGNRKQAMVPRGRDDPRAGRHRARARRAAAGRRRRPRRSSCCPGRRASCSRCGRRRSRPTRFHAALAGRGPSCEQRMLRLFGIPESEIAGDAAGDRGRRRRLDALEITTCLRRGEIEIVTRFEPDGGGRVRRASRPASRARHADTLFSDDGATVDEQVAALLLERADASPSAESCTGGLLAARLTDRPGLLGLRARAGWSPTRTRPKTALAGVAGRADRARRRGVARRSRWRWPTARSTRFGADVGIGRHGRRRARRRHRRTSRSGTVHVSVARAGDGRGDGDALGRVAARPGCVRTR